MLSDHRLTDEHESWLGDDIFYRQYQRFEDAFMQRKYVATRFLAAKGFNTPRIYGTYCPGSTDFASLTRNLPTTFVLKPDMGQQGQEVYLFRRSNGGFIDQYDRTYQPDDLEQLCRQDYQEAWMRAFAPRNEIRLFCEQICSHPLLANLYKPECLIDYRLYFIGNRFVGGFMRVPTDRSSGLGNMCLGAQAFNLDESGAVVAETDLLVHQSTFNRNTGEDLRGFTVPFWEKALRTIADIPHSFASKLVCIDGTIDEKDDFVVLEITLKPVDYMTHNDQLRRLIESADCNETSALASDVAHALLTDTYGAG